VRRRDGSEWICPHCGEIAEFCECAHAECGCVVGDVFDDFDADELGLDPEEEYDA